jgi:importin-4
MTQIAIGLQKHFTNQPNNDEHFKWEAGVPAKKQL